MSDTDSTTTKVVLSTLLSANRSATYPTWLLQNSIEQVDSYCFGGFSGLNTLYNIDSRNSKIYLTQRATGSTTSSVSTITIPTANYTSTDIISQLNTSLSSQGTVSYSVTCNTTNNKITFSTGTSGSFAFLSGQSDLYYELGIQPDQLTSTTASLTGAQSFDFSGVKEIRVCSNAFGQNCNSLIGSNYSVLCSIPVAEAFNSVITAPSDQTFVTSDATNVQTISCNLIDERNRTITDNVRDWSMSIFVRNV